MQMQCIISKKDFSKSNFKCLRRNSEFNSNLIKLIYANFGVKAQCQHLPWIDHIYLPFVNVSIDPLTKNGQI
jgi:hypothetical protein